MNTKNKGALSFMIYNRYLKHLEITKILFLQNDNIFDEEKDYFCVKCGRNLLDCISFKVRDSYMICEDCLAHSTIKYARSGDLCCIDIMISFAEEYIKENCTHNFGKFLGDECYGHAF